MGARPPCLKHGGPILLPTCTPLATATTADSNPPSTSNEREGTTATASTATPSICDERETTLGCLVLTHPELSRDCEVLLRNDLTDNQKLDLVRH